MIAVSAYFRQICLQSPEIDQADLAAVMDQSIRNTNRWLNSPDEKTATSVRAVDLFRAMEFLGVPIEDVLTLFFQEDATAETGRDLAKQHLERSSKTLPATVQEAYDQVPDEELDVIEDVLIQLRGDPQRLGAWLGYGQRLADERAAVVNRRPFVRLRLPWRRRQRPAVPPDESMPSTGAPS